MITLIDRESVFRAKPETMNEKVKRVSETRTIIDRSYAKGWNACLKMWNEEIEKIPLVERTKGMWVLTDTMYACNQCHSVFYETSPFCPNCGADMRGEQNE